MYDDIEIKIAIINASLKIYRSCLLDLSGSKFEVYKISKEEAAKKIKEEEHNLQILREQHPEYFL